jgi:hypothetical protein
VKPLVHELLQNNIGYIAFPAALFDPEKEKFSLITVQNQVYLFLFHIKSTDPLTGPSALVSVTINNKW